MGTIFDNFDGTVGTVDLSVFSKNNPDPKTPLRRHYLSLVGLLQWVDIINDEFDWTNLSKDRRDAIQKYMIDHSITEKTIMGMINQCIGDLDTRMAVFQKDPSGKQNWFWCESVDGKSNVFHMKGDYEYSFDGIEWTEYDGENDPEFNNRIYIRALPQETQVRIDCEGDFNVGGNILSLLYGSKFTGEETEFPAGSSFAKCFTGSHVHDASQLILPIYLVKGCFEDMFANCSAMVAAPEIFATTMAAGCFASMFNGCTSLTEVKMHIEGEWKKTDAGDWLVNVAETGILYNLGGATDIPESNPSGCPEGWTIYPNPNTVPGEEPSNPIDVTGTELEQLLTPSNEPDSNPVPEEEEEEEEGTPTQKNNKTEKSAPSVVQIGYFYNVTEPSTRFAKGVYTIIDKSNAVPFTAVVTESELKKLINEGSLVPDTTYFVPSSKENMICYAISTKDTDKIFQQPTGWTPENPIMVTGQELDDLIDCDLLNNGYFYKVTDTTGTEYFTGLYVAYKGDVEPFDRSNMVTSGQLSQMIEDEELKPNAIYYILDYYGDKETNAVIWAETNSTYVQIERSRSPKPEPKPENPKGWTFNEPILCAGKELNGYIESSTLYQYYFYHADSDFEQIKAETTYLATENGKVVEFGKNNAQLDEDMQKMAQLETLTPDAYYFATDTEVLYLAVDTKTLEKIERTPVSDK